MRAWLGAVLTAVLLLGTAVPMQTHGATWRPAAWTASTDSPVASLDGRASSTLAGGERGLAAEGWEAVALSSGRAAAPIALGDPPASGLWAVGTAAADSIGGPGLRAEDPLGPTIASPSRSGSAPTGWSGDPSVVRFALQAGPTASDRLDALPLRLPEGRLPPEGAARVADPPFALSAAQPVGEPALRPALEALQAAPVPPSSAASLQVSGVLMYRFVNGSVPPAAGGGNLNSLSPTPDTPTIHDGILEAAITWTPVPVLTVFADLSLEYQPNSVQWGASDIENLYLDVHDIFGVTGSGIRLGRDRIKLGFTGLLLDETVFDGGRREGVEVRLTQLGPVSVFGFMQYALDDGLQVGNWTSTRRVWGAHAEAEVAPGWSVDVNYRADTAGADEVGTCPGVGCNVGSGFSAGLQGDLGQGMNLILEAATYTQSGGTGQWYYDANLALDLTKLVNIQTLQPLLTVWYKNFDPYTPPLDAPLGHLLTPDDFREFNTNDNLTAVGARLDVTITPAVGAFILSEWGTYKGGGPTYNVYSIGVKYAVSADTVLKATYNGYSVAGDVVTTSPISGLMLSNAQIFEFELTKSF